MRGRKDTRTGSVCVYSFLYMRQPTTAPFYSIIDTQIKVAVLKVGVENIILNIILIYNDLS